MPYITHLKTDLSAVSFQHTLLNKAHMSEASSKIILADEKSEEYKLVKAADRLSAYIKCLEELRSGNNEFSRAKKSIEEDLKSRKMPCVDYFFKHFISSYNLNLDELEGM